MFCLWCEFQIHKMRLNSSFKSLFSFYFNLSQQSKTSKSRAGSEEGTALQMLLLEDSVLMCLRSSREGCRRPC